MDPHSFTSLADSNSNPLRCTTHNFIPPDVDAFGYHTLAADMGKGILTHIWFVHNVLDSGTRIQLWVDGALISEGTIKEFVTASQGTVRSPLAYETSGASVCDVQIPYSKNFALLYKQSTGDLFWYAVQWRPVELNVELPAIGSSTYEAMQLAAESKFVSRDFWNNYPSESISFSHNFTEHDTLDLLSVEGSGIIQELRFKPSLIDQASLDSLLLEMYWDDYPLPSVRVTIGDIFGALVWPRANTSLFLKSGTNGDMQISFPMPFQNKAHIRLINLREYPVFVEGSIKYHKENIDRKKTGYFFTQTQETNPTRYGVWHPVLHTLGKGKYVGMVFQLPHFANAAALEGDPKFTVDSNASMSFRLTGTEDYFNGGNYFIDGPFTSAFGGCINWATAMCRFHCFDAMNFNSSFDFDFQHGYDNDVKEDYRTVALYYKQWTPFWTSRDTIRANETWTISGNGYAPKSNIAVRFDDGELVFNTEATVEGTFAKTITVPSSWKTGKRYLLVNEEQKPEPIYILSRPTISVINDVLPPLLKFQDTLLIAGAGFVPGEILTFFLDSIPIETKGEVITGDDYRFKGIIIIPNISEDWKYHLVAQGDKGNRAICEDLISITRNRSYEFEDLVPSALWDAGICKEQNLAGNWYARWSKQGIAIFDPGSANHHITFSILLPVTDTFIIKLRLTKGEQFADYSYALDGIKKGVFKGYFPSMEPTDSIDLGTLYLTEGKHTISFNYIGHDNAVNNYLLGPDVLLLTPTTKMPLDKGVWDTTNHAGTVFLQNQFSATGLLFPNPIENGILNFLIDKGTTIIEISDLLGRRILTKKMFVTDSQVIQFSVDGFVPGNYILTATTTSLSGLRHITAPFVVIR